MIDEQFKTSLRSQYKHTSSFIMGCSMAFTDAVVIMLAITTGFFIMNLITPEEIWLRSCIKYAIFLPLIFCVFYGLGLYPGITLASEDEVRLASIGTFFCMCSASIAIATIKSQRHYLPIAAALMIAWPLCTIGLPVVREFARGFFCHFSWWGVPVVIYTSGDNYKVIIDRLLGKKYLGYKPILIITSDKIHTDKYRGITIINNSEELTKTIKTLHIKVAIICGYKESVEEIQTNYRYFIRIPRNQLTTTLSLKMKNFGGLLGFSSTNYLTKIEALILKRLIDIILCLIAAPFVILITIFVSIGIKITSPGPIFYGHKRVGKNHSVLKCWKFRSMCIDADVKLKEILANDPVRAAEWEKDRKFTDDPRVTKFGKFLRKTSLDELPQLWNIFVGEMSFIGPRPVTEPELIKYNKYVDYILSVKPGLSGMWQISGRSDTGYEERIMLDTYYIQNWSIWLDIWIIIKTIYVVLRRKGAY
ncbi:exopolysaccharide biosynthesis polyprenyl glycosylphosphotransferase [Treponema zioleckii]|uniref:exopolysaccharide biosynthesis polyprenyl glycosylphosphotransferase n=1 Tax=Treponema zioleckii TaxID=331680 RepID=UPI00168B8E53|nr:exopolysaccharide biosynthesis polyprenyl glycosylphosphotransferase [Treponema zioleckii]